MKKGKWLSAAMAMALGFGALSFNVLNDKTYAESKIDPAKVQVPSYGSAFDLAVANDDKLIEMLKKNGTIPKGASASESQKALQSYLKKRSGGSSEPGELHKHEKELRGKLNGQLNQSGLVNGKGNKLGQAKKGPVQPVTEENWTGGERKDNVLVLLVEYPDFPHNNIQPEETDMHYADYTKEHYENMIFGENGYEGPNGEKLVSVKQFYEQQSGGSYTIDGTVAGWYKAKHPAKYYGGNVAPYDNDGNARGLVKEALAAAGQDSSIDLKKFDQEDRYDLDGDGNHREPDGLIDHLMVVHSSVGEEAGGGALGADAIWSHRWNLGGVSPIAGTQADVGYWGGSMAAYDYTIEPADGAAGVFAHEYGHDLGLPDEYDTQYTGSGEPVSYWSIMSSGSWAGKVPGTEPTGFSAYAKEFLHASMPNSNWLNGPSVHVNDIPREGLEVTLDQANTKGTNSDAVRIDLPDKEIKVNTPFGGSYEYFSGKGDGLNNSMITSVDLTSAKQAELNFKTWYKIEADFDYASVQVKEEGSSTWTTIPGNLTTDTNPNEANPGHGITGDSNGWVDAKFDLSAYTGKKIQMKLNYLTDGGVSEAGFYVDDITVTADGKTVISDGAEDASAFSFEGFSKSNGTYTTKHYYLLEWRSHNGVDQGLGHIRRGASLMSFDPGLLVWYVDESYDNNWTGVHPGNGYLGVVDADQGVISWSDKDIASTGMQVHDAAFGLTNTNKMFLDYTQIYGATVTDNDTTRNPLFDDSQSYMNAKAPDAGRAVPKYGLKIRVTGESTDKTVGKVLIYR